MSYWNRLKPGLESPFSARSKGTGTNGTPGPIGAPKFAPFLISASAIAGNCP